MDNIQDLIANKEFEKAEALLLDKIQESNIEDLKNLGLCQVNLGKFENALQTFLKVIEINSKDATALFYLGFLYEKNNNDEEAEKCYLKVIELREQFFDAYKNLTVLYTKLKKFDKASKIIKTAYDLSKDNQEDASIPFLYANTLVLLNRQDDAILLFEETLSVNSEHVPALSTLATLHMQKQNFDKAFDLYQKALSIEPDNALSNFNLGMWYMIKSDFKNAKKYFNIAYKFEKNIQYLSQLALAQFKTSDYDSAAISYQKLCTLNPQSLNFRFNYALCLYEQKNYKMAISVLLPIVQQNPKSAIMAHRLALCFQALGQIKNAGAIYERILKLGKIPTEVYFDYVGLLILDKDYQKAEMILNKLLKINPDLAVAHKDLGVLYLIQRLFDEAKDEFEIAIKLEPENPLIIFEYANYFQAVASFEEAEKYYIKANNLLPHQEDICLMYGFNQLKLRKYDKAKELLQFVVANNPQAHSALLTLAEIEITFKNFDTAKEYLTDAYIINPTTETSNMLAQTYMELNDYHNAKVVLNNLNNEIPNNPTILTTLAKAEILDNNPEMAKTYLEQALAIFPELEEANSLLSSLS